MSELGMTALLLWLVSGLNRHKDRDLARTLYRLAQQYDTRPTPLDAELTAESWIAERFDS